MTVLRTAANILDTSEFDVLSHAYEHWYGESASTEMLNQAFSNYLKTQELPHWARHYALGVITRFEAEMRVKWKRYSLFWQLAWDSGSRLAEHNHVLLA